jgi:hypothetical protein
MFNTRFLVKTFEALKTSKVFHFTFAETNPSLPFPPISLLNAFDQIACVIT